LNAFPGFVRLTAHFLGEAFFIYGVVMEMVDIAGNGLLARPAGCRVRILPSPPLKNLLQNLLRVTEQQKAVEKQVG
jgi:hypothetical protein